MRRQAGIVQNTFCTIPAPCYCQPDPVDLLVIPLLRVGTTEWRINEHQVPDSVLENYGVDGLVCGGVVSSYVDTDIVRVALWIVRVTKFADVASRVPPCCRPGENVRIDSYDTSNQARPVRIAKRHFYELRGNVITRCSCIVIVLNSYARWRPAQHRHGAVKDNIANLSGGEFDRSSRTDI